MRVQEWTSSVTNQMMSWLSRDADGCDAVQNKIQLMTLPTGLTAHSGGDVLMAVDWPDDWLHRLTAMIRAGEHRLMSDWRSQTGASPQHWSSYIHTSSSLISTILFHNRSIRQNCMNNRAREEC